MILIKAFYWLATVILAFSAGYELSLGFNNNEIHKLETIIETQKTTAEIINQSINDHIIGDKNVTNALNKRLDFLQEMESKTIKNFHSELTQLLADVSRDCQPDKARRR